MTIIDTVHAIRGEYARWCRLTDRTQWRISIQYANELATAFRDSWVSTDDIEAEPTLMGLPIVWDTVSYRRIIALEERPAEYIITTNYDAAERRVY